jgi:phage terminase large subunit-like protein
VPDTLTPASIEAQLSQFAYHEQVYLKAEMEWIARARAKAKPLPGANWFSQILPKDFDTALVMTGRGWGKTDTASNWVRRKAYLHPGSIGHVVAPTFSDLRYVLFEGPAGLLHAIPDDLIADYNRSDYTLTLVNGTFVRGFSAEKPDRLRGPQCHWLWGDEVAAWQRLDDTMSNIDPDQGRALREQGQPRRALRRERRQARRHQARRPGNPRHPARLR